MTLPVVNEEQHFERTMLRNKMLVQNFDFLVLKGMEAFPVLTFLAKTYIMRLVLHSF